MENNKVTQQQIDDLINDSEIVFSTLFDKTTVAAIKLPNGFVIVESSSCVDPKNYDEQISFDICMKRIREKLWELEGYLLQQKLFLGGYIIGDNPPVDDGEQLKMELDQDE